MNLAFAFLWWCARHLGFSGVLLVVGWYAGAKFGAPDYLAPITDPIFNRAEAAVASVLGGEANPGEDASPEE